MNSKATIADLAVGTGKATKFVVTERIITIATRIFTDVPMISLILADPKIGWLKCLIYVTPMYVLVCAAIVYISDRFHEKGIDITGIEEMRRIGADGGLGRNQLVKRFVRWFMKRESLIFWFGSIFYLDPDYVTLMLRRKGDTFLKTMLRLTVPSVLVSMSFWTALYWVVYQPFKHTEWAKWIAEWL